MLKAGSGLIHRIKIRLLLSTIFFSIICNVALAAESGIKGRVFTDSGPLAGARVFAHRNMTDQQKNAPPVAESVADKTGVYDLKLPPGTYFFTARGTRDGHEYFAYHGSNPIRTDDDENLWLGLMATGVDPPPVYKSGSTSLEGVITYKGQPVAGARVAVYGADSKSLKGLGTKTDSVDVDGRFKLSVDPGIYVVTARRLNDSSSNNRQPQKGDLYCFYSHNPVEVKDDKTASIEFSCYPKTDRNAFVTTLDVKPANYKTLAERAATSGNGIRGRVVEAGGQPAAGITVTAYMLPSPVFLMSTLYHSTEYIAETDASGSFFIPIDDAGDYAVFAGKGDGDGTQRYGIYQGNQRHAVTFKQGAVAEKISIIVDKGQKTSGKMIREGSRDQSRVSGTPGGAPVLLTDEVIDKDTVWQGEIHISGVISVKRGATLTIRPGTIVKFRPNGQEIGNGEIFIEGRLVAQGSKDAKITFTSAAQYPAINDWSYLQFVASDLGSIIENCLFEYAFAGVMLHDSDVRIAQTIFSNNNLGVNLNIQKLRLEHNSFLNNRIGIRLIGLGGDLIITNNQITRNYVGILFVPKQYKTAAPELPKRENFQFKENNIFDNRNYSFYVGEGESRSIDFSGNWWGTSESDAIRKTIYDNAKGKSLHRILFEPNMTTPILGAGAGT